MKNNVSGTEDSTSGAGGVRTRCLLTASLTLFASIHAPTRGHDHGLSTDDPTLLRFIDNLLRCSIVEDNTIIVLSLGRVKYSHTICNPSCLYVKCSAIACQLPSFTQNVQKTSVLSLKGVKGSNTSRTRVYSGRVSKVGYSTVRASRRRQELL